MNNYERRWNNAVRIAKQINAFIDDGYLVFGDNGELIKNKFVITDEGIRLPLDENSSVAYFINDKNLDNGMHTTISEYNKEFLDWRILYPYDIQSLDL